MKSDLQIKKDVINELKWDPAIKSNQVGVSVSGGVVTLSGHIENYSQKNLIEEAVARVYGVKAVAMELDVKIDVNHKHSDSDIAKFAEHVLKWHSQVPDENIRLKVEKGWITLSGEVHWDFQRRNAEMVLRPLNGVTGVTNLITLKSSVTPSNVSDLIKKALTRHAEREAKAIQVEVDGSTVTLRGKVDNWSERDAALGAAWSAPGITRVINELHFPP